MVLSNTLSLVLYLITFIYTILVAIYFQECLSKGTYKVICIKIFNYKYIINRLHLIFFVMIFLFIFILSAIRINVGTDYHSYKYIFENVQMGGIYSGNIITVELLYKVFAFTISILTNNQSFFFLCNMVLTMFPIYLLCLKKNKEIDISFFLLLYLTIIWGMTLNITRQGISISIISYSLYYFVNKQPKKYILCVILASLFHKSAIIFIGFYVLRNLRNKSYSKIFKALFIIAIILFPFVYQNLFMILSNVLSRYTGYIKNTSELFSSSFLYLIEKVLLILPVIYARKYISGNFYFLLSFIAIDIILFFPSLTFSYLYRLSYYFLPVYCLVIANLIKNLKLNHLRIYNVFRLYYLIYGISYFILNYFILGMHEIFPYQF